MVAKSRRVQVIAHYLVVPSGDQDMENFDEERFLSHEKAKPLLEGGVKQLLAELPNTVVVGRWREGLYSRECSLSNRGMPRYQWEDFRNKLPGKGNSIASDINAKSKTPDSQGLYFRVYGSAASRWLGPTISMDLGTGLPPSCEKTNTLEIGFYVRHLPKTK